MVVGPVGIETELFGPQREAKNLFPFGQEDRHDGEPGPFLAFGHPRVKLPRRTGQRLN